MLFMGSLPAERGQCFELVDEGGYSSPDIKYWVRNNTIKNRKGEIVVLQEINRKNAYSDIYDDHIEDRKVLVDDFKNSRGLVNNLLCSTFGKVSQYKDINTTGFNKALNSRRDLRYEYLYYRREIIELETKLEFENKAVPVADYSVKRISKELDDIKACFAIVKQLIKDIDARFLQINMEKEMRKRLSDTKGTSVFQLLLESDCKIGLYDTKMGKLREKLNRCETWQVEVITWEMDEIREKISKEQKTNRGLKEMAEKEAKKRLS